MTTPWVAQVRDFHEAMNLPKGVEFISKHNPLILLRYRLIQEEFNEVAQELLKVDEEKDFPNLAKELADLIIVAIGTALTFGIDIDMVMAHVHHSNMSKLDDDGNPIYNSDGKVMKGPNYQPPDLSWMETNDERILHRGDS